MDKLVDFSKLFNRLGNLTPEESEDFVSLWNFFFGKTLGRFIESPAEAYELCTAEAAE
jgi:hypothetical protein